MRGRRRHHGREGGSATEQRARSSRGQQSTSGAPTCALPWFHAQLRHVQLRHLSVVRAQREAAGTSGAERGQEVARDGAVQSRSRAASSCAPPTRCFTDSPLFRCAPQAADCCPCSASRAPPDRLDTAAGLFLTRPRPTLASRLLQSISVSPCNPLRSPRDRSGRYTAPGGNPTWTAEFTFIKPCRALPPPRCGSPAPLGH